MSSGTPRPGPAGQRQATVLESVEELRSLLRRGQTVREAAVPPPPTAEDDTLPYRPIQRPGMALLTVLDDGDDDGEVFRIRGASFVIGRAEGDLVIPHDSGISGRHAEISRRFEEGQFRWYLKDLQSTNGTFVRASGGILHNGQEILVGGHRLRFDLAPAVEFASQNPAVATTQKMHSLTPRQATESGQPTLVELTAQGPGRRFRLTEPETWLGRDPKACTVVVNDPMVSPRHARCYRDERGRWCIKNARSLNGLWLRIDEIALDRGGQFQCGEQRFLVKVP